ncbi:MAG: hypothetical protein KatS3mg103_0398 [Phycisphaerales bacterium]|nr:MAG: hypothetical protein KatS3mg103_0398 [Phycisphaerales bacterium]
MAQRGLLVVLPRASCWSKRLTRTTTPSVGASSSWRSRSKASMACRTPSASPAVRRGWLVGTPRARRRCMSEAWSWAMGGSIRPLPWATKRRLRRRDSLGSSILMVPAVALRGFMNGSRPWAWRCSLRRAKSVRAMNSSPRTSSTPGSAGPSGWRRRRRGDRRDGADGVGDVVALLPIAAGQGVGQLALLVAQADGHAVDLGVAGVAVGLGPIPAGLGQQLVHAPGPVADLLWVVGVVDAEHRHGVGGASRSPRWAPRRRGPSGCWDRPGPDALPPARPARPGAGRTRRRS